MQRKRWYEYLIWGQKEVLQIKYYGVLKVLWKLIFWGSFYIHLLATLIFSLLGSIVNVPLTVEWPLSHLIGILLMFWKWAYWYLYILRLFSFCFALSFILLIIYFSEPKFLILANLVIFIATMDIFYLYSCRGLFVLAFTFKSVTHIGVVLYVI